MFQRKVLLPDTNWPPYVSELPSSTAGLDSDLGIGRPVLLWTGQCLCMCLRCLRVPSSDGQDKLSGREGLRAAVPNCVYRN